MNSEAMMGLLRQALTFLGGLFAGYGWITADQASSVANNLMVAIPALVSVGSIAWSVYVHWKQVKVPESTIVHPPAAPAMTAADAVKTGALKES